MIAKKACFSGLLRLKTKWKPRKSGDPDTNARYKYLITNPNIIHYILYYLLNVIHHMLNNDNINLLLY